MPCSSGASALPLEYSNHLFYKYNLTIAPLAPPQVDPFRTEDITNTTLTPTSISFLVPIPTVSFLNGPLIGYTISYTGSVFGSKIFQSLTTLDVIDTRDSQTIFLPAGNNITVINLIPNYIFSLSISASNSEGTTGSKDLGFELPPASKYYLYIHIHTRYLSVSYSSQVQVHQSMCLCLLCPINKSMFHGVSMFLL